MSELSVSSLFLQLQARYPLSGLVTELLHIHDGLFVVRASVQVQAVAIATGMAAATTLEAAEDQARLRVLHLLGIDSAVANQLLPAPTAPPSPGLLAFPGPVPIAPPSLVPPGPGGDRVSAPAPVVPPVMPPPPITRPPIAPPPVAAPAEPLTGLPLPIPSAEPEPGPSAVPSLPVGLDVPLSPALTVPEAIAPLGGSAAELVDPIPDDSSQYDSNQYDPSQYDPTEYETASYEELEAADPDEEPLPPVEVPPSKSEKVKPRKTSKTTKAQPAIAPSFDLADPSQGLELNDLSSIIAMTDVEMDRIGWDKTQGREHLKATYGKATRQKLDAEELMDFLNYLRALPSLHGL